MTDAQKCPLCTETYDDPTDLRVHLEVHHRKSEVVSCLVEREPATTDVATERDSRTVDEERPAPSA
ncbi:C2H2-type zinc finger protein [Natrinema caseinilyticum]|uniref:C2H2-type zinc finger protein n=1 Tax=Natrinema caseinilyticum TaxID=2961570 RepID=UPI0020C47425|nr:C2H2-type zinc finger protein [Natrinema caseinilyticum]